MTLKKEFINTGEWLFRKRSYLPLFFIPVIIIAFRNYSYPFGNYSLDVAWKFFCFTISLLGLGIRMFTVGSVPLGTSGGGTRSQVAQSLNTKGLYSIVRHPLYLANLIIWIGIVSVLRSGWFILLTLFAFTMLYERIMFAEEDYLEHKFGNTFLDWAQKTPAFFPKIKNWEKPDLQFCFKTAIKKEYDAFFAIIFSFTFLEVISNFYIYGKLYLSIAWIIIFTLNLIVFFGIKIIKKYTTILNVPGR